MHRVPGGKTGTVYALRSELDAWLSSKRGNTHESSDPDAGIAAQKPKSQISGKWTRGVSVAVALVTFCAAINAWWMAGRASAVVRAPVSISTVASDSANPETTEFARALTADLARFANASSNLAVFEREPKAAPTTQYVVRTELERKNSKIYALTRLIAAQNGEVLWSQRFEQSNPALSTLREQIAANIVGMLQCSFGKLDDEKTMPRTVDMAQLMAICQDVDEDNLGSAQARAHQLTLTRPDLAISWAWLAVVQGWMIDSNDTALRAQAISNALHAKKIAPNKACTWLAQAAVAEGGFSGPNALPFVQQGLQMHPGHPTLLSHASMILFNVGYVKDSVAPALDALRSDPSSLQSRDIAVRRLAAAGRTREALGLQDETEQLWPGHPRPLATRAQLFDDVGTSNSFNRDAIMENEREVTAHPNVAYRLAYFHERTGNRRAALDWLARAPVKYAYQQWSVLLLPDAARLRQEPAFFKKMVDLGLVGWWVARKQWPDFCSEPGLRYNCASEATKYGFRMMS